VVQEIDPVELVAKTPACFDRGAEVRLTESVVIEIVFGDYLRVARRPG
jgi:hypothetical protein